MNMQVRAVGSTPQRFVTLNKHPIIVNRTVVERRWEVLDVNDVDFLIGTDIMNEVGIYVNGIIEAECGMSDRGELDEDVRPSNHTRVSQSLVGKSRDQVSSNIVLKRLFQELRKNEATASLPCTADGSIISIQIIPGKRSQLKSIRRNWLGKNDQDAFRDQASIWNENRITVVNHLSGVLNHPVLVVTRRDESGIIVKRRFCLDPTRLNDITIDDQIIVPKVKDIVQWGAGHKFYTTLDIKDGFHKFKVDEETSKLLAFTDPDGVQHRFVRAPFGLKQLVSTFSRVMATVLKDCPWAMNYIDDILIVGGSSLDEHIERVKTVILKLTEVNLTLNKEKSVFAASAVKVLGFIVDVNGSYVDKSRLEKTMHWAKPQTGKDIQSFLGFINYFREYIPDYSKLTGRFEELRSVKTVVWNEELDESFESLKRHMVHNASVLSPFNSDLPVILETDASGYAIGAVLYQLDLEGKRRYIQFYSKQLSTSQAKYSTTKKELLAIVLAFRKWREFLFGRKFTVVTDHKALEFLREQRDVNAMIARWSDVLFEHSFSVKYRPGREHILPDFLSRQVNIRKIRTEEEGYSCNWALNDRWFRVLEVTYGKHDIDLFADKINCKLKQYASDDGTGLGDAFQLDWGKFNSIYANVPFRSISKVLDKVVADKATMTMVVPVALGSRWFNKLLSMCVDQPTFINHSSDTFLKYGTTLVGKPPWKWTAAFRISADPAISKVIVNDIFWSKIGFKPTSSLELSTANYITSRRASAVVSPVITQMVKNRVVEIHEYGHMGSLSIVETLLDEGYELPPAQLMKIAEGVTSSCIGCARNSKKRKGYHPLTHIVADLPFDHIAIDLCKMELSSKGMNYVLVVKDVLTKFIVLRALTSKTADAVAKELWSIFTLLGFPRILQSDNGTEFRNKILAAWGSMGLFDHRCTTPYHPRANGVVERANSDIIRMLKALCRGKTTTWCEQLDRVQYYKNLATSRTHKSSPFSLMFLRRFNPFESDYSSEVPLTDDQIIEALDKRVEDLRSAAAVVYPSAAKTLGEYNKKQLESQARHQKLLERLPPKTTVMIVNRGKQKKLDDDFVGPFTVVRSDRAGSYQLMDSTGMLTSRKIPISDIRVVSLPDPDELAYEVEAILEDKIENGLQLYLTKWRGFDDSFNTWEPVNNFNELELIAEYHRNKLCKTRVRRISRRRR
jgi:hypothetical protein